MISLSEAAPVSNWNRVVWYGRYLSRNAGQMLLPKVIRARPCTTSNNSFYGKLLGSTGLASFCRSSPQGACLGMDIMLANCCLTRPTARADTVECVA